MFSFFETIFTKVTSLIASVIIAVATGSTIKILRTTVVAIAFNPTLTCDQLGIPNSERDACKLYKSSKSDYTWDIVDS